MVQSFYNLDLDWSFIFSNWWNDFFNKNYQTKKMKYILLLIFLLSTGFLFYEGLKTDPSLVPSNLISKKVPIFELKKLNNHELLTPSDLQNQEQFKIVNFFASWCPPL